MQFVCPDGGMDAAVALQRAADEGHQPWWLSAPDMAAACTFGISRGGGRTRRDQPLPVSHPGSGQSAIVDLTQPLGPNGIWVVTSVTPLATTAAG